MPEELVGSINQVHFQYGRDLETAGANAAAPSVGIGTFTYGSGGNITITNKAAIHADVIDRAADLRFIAVSATGSADKANGFIAARGR